MLKTSKVVFGLIMLLFCLTLVNARLGEFDKDSCVNIRVISTESNVNLSTITINSKTYALDTPMQHLAGETFNYTYCNNSEYGNYVYDWYPCDNVGNCVNDYMIGKTLDLSQAFIFIFIAVALLVILIFSVYGINRALKGEWQIFYICLSYVLVFSLLFLGWFIAKEYLYYVPLLERILWISWIIMGALFLPFIIFVSAYILKKQAEALLEDDFKKQGYTQEEAREMSKRRR